MSENKLLEIKNLQTFFNVEKGLLKAVNGVNLSIARGESVGLVGESGCGKSTLGKSILRIYKPYGGTIEYKGKDINKFDRAEAKQYTKEVQMIFQDPYASLDPLCVVGEIIAEGINAHGLYTGKEKVERLYELLNMVGLNKEHINRYPHEFSGGQRQRVGIARALSVEPELIVCDEPISALDVSIQAQIVNLLRKLQRDMGLSYLFITHDLSMVRQISERIAVMYLGQMVEIAPSQEIYDTNYHPYTKALLSAIPVADPIFEKARKRIPISGDVPSPINLPPGCSFCKRCPYATEECRNVQPVMRELSNYHFVACHRAEEIN